MNRLHAVRRVGAVVVARRISVGGGGVQRQFASADRIRSSISKLLDNQEPHLQNDASAALELHASLEALKVRISKWIKALAV
jgi:hypothetical protein